MRRVIERKVTVVTTTTWTISWHDDPLHPSSKADPVHPVVSNTGVLPAAQNASPIIEIKEAEIAREEKVDDQTKLTNFVKSKPSKPERN